jgi:hypothetical protein
VFVREALIIIITILVVNEVLEYLSFRRSSKQSYEGGEVQPTYSISIGVRKVAAYGFGFTVLGSVVGGLSIWKLIERLIERRSRSNRM